ncbi:unnamed protein product [Brachionus calyciflorus]|uniref:DUF4550 domain-containing protein n=1 Tax=Brachionus calyciflorus TaxID=104777 RepID=A0A813URP5_9BILA|nr:unnamed protein product [Brachionus calyciflorus]
MSDFQTDQNHSEILRSDFNLTTNSHDLETNKQNENELNYADTFSSYHSNDEIKPTSSNEQNNEPFETNHFLLSDNNFSLNDKEDIKNMNVNCIESEEFDENGEEIHKVNFKITILASFPIEKEAEKEYSLSDSSNKPRATEGPKPIHFYRFEYQLIPDDPDTLYATDLVTFKQAVKIYPDKFEPKVIRGWENDNKIWATWSISHEIGMTKSSLLKFFEYEIVLKIWDSKDLCSPRARFDKPKPFKFSKNENAEETIKLSVMEQSNRYLKQIPVELHDKLPKKLPNQKKNEEINENGDRLSNTLIAVPSNSAMSQANLGNKLNELASDKEMNKNVKSKYTERNIRTLSKMSKASSRSDSKTPKTSLKKEKSKKETVNEQEYIRKNGTARIRLKTKILYSGNNYYMVRLDEPPSTIDDCFITIDVENTLMSEQQLFDLNPMTIKIEKVTNMPNKPLTYEQLKNQCEKTYCSYSFFKSPIHKTESISQDKNLFFNDTDVYLTGQLNRDELKEYLHHSPLEIEVHDRDRKRLQTHEIKPSLFGNDPIDDQISSVNSVSAKHTIHNPFDTKDRCWDPYGIAKLDLYELFLGKKLLEFFVPVLPCKAPDVLGKNVYKHSSNTKVIGFEDYPLSPGNFLDSNTHINVKITTAKPLFHNKLSKAQASISSQPVCVFGRILIKIDANKMKNIRDLIHTVNKINAKCLKFDSHSLEVQEAALSTYKLNEEESFSKSLDLVTGFHLIDPQCHLFVLEGLKDHGIKKIYEKVLNCESDCQIIFNSSMGFSQRLYSKLDVELLKVKLFEPLEQIVKKPLLYIRDMTPKISFDSLIKLNQLLQEYKLRDIIRCDLLPTADMILSMSKEFGVPLTEKETKQYQYSEKFSEKVSSANNKENLNPVDPKLMNDFDTANITNIPHTSRIWTPIDNTNDQFMAQKKDKQVQMKNYLLENVKQIPEISEKNKFKRPLKRYITADTAFNYSSQTLNSTDLALDKFRDMIQKSDSDTLYTYATGYHHSSTFVPLNIKQEEKDKMEESKNMWKTTEGWIYPDVKTSLVSNEHPKKLDQASLDHINEPWEENFFHAYKMKSPLDRTFFKGSMRRNDFNVWSKPKIENILPNTIFEAGDTKDKLEKENLEEEKTTWASKVIVDNTEVNIFKLSGATEMKISGAKSSNQIDKLTGLLKSEPKKKGLLFRGVNFNNIPALSVIKTEYEDENTKFVNSKGFISGDDKNLRITDDRNKIPVHYYNHSKFSNLNGKDFDLYGPARSPIYKRSIELLSFDSENLKSNMFIWPNKSDYQTVEKLSLPKAKIV